MNRLLCAITASILPLLACPAMADVTAPAGSGQATSTVQTSLGLTCMVRTTGLFPASNGSPVGTIGEVAMFAGNFTPGGYLPADGRLLPIAQNTALFSLLGTTYGGDGQTSFALPDLRGRTPIGTGQGAGLTPRMLGDLVGAEHVALSAGNLPSHAHTLPTTPVTSTDSTGVLQPYENMQPSLAVNYIVPLQGIFPSREGSLIVSSGPTLGFVYATAASYLPDGWNLAAGQMLPISQNSAVFSLLGTTYGGNGTTTFALPDMRGLAAIGQGLRPGQDAQYLGEVAGSETLTMSLGQMPAHTHALPPASDLTGMAGIGQPQSRLQPSLGLNYIIATNGLFPMREGDGTEQEPLLGQISLFAGNFAPGGWSFCEGQLLPIAQNSALFSLLGTMYGGNGTTTFALPDLRGSLAVGAGAGPGLSPWDIGEVAGNEYITLTQNQMPDHAHTYIPEPATLALVLLGAGLLRPRCARSRIRRG